jgi:hypothetical protein
LRPCLEEEPCWRLLAALHKLAEGRPRVLAGIDRLAKVAGVWRLAAWLAGKKLVAYSRGRVGLTDVGLANVEGGLRPWLKSGGGLTAQAPSRSHAGMAKKPAGTCEGGEGVERHGADVGGHVPAPRLRPGASRVP